MKTRYLILTLVLLHYGLCVQAYASEKITLQEAITLALNQNHRIKQMDYQMAENRTGEGIARSNQLPQLNLFQTFQRTDNAPQSFFFKLNERQLDMTKMDFNHPGTNTDYESKIQFSQPLFTGGKISQE